MSTYAKNQVMKTWNKISVIETRMALKLEEYFKFTLDSDYS